MTDEVIVLCGLVVQIAADEGDTPQFIVTQKTWDDLENSPWRARDGDPN